MAGPEAGRPARSQGAGRDRAGIAAIAVALLAVVCCAAGPAILAAFASVALGAVVGWAAGAVAALAVAVGVVVVVRRRHRSAPLAASKRTRR